MTARAPGRRTHAALLVALLSAAAVTIPAPAVRADDHEILAGGGATGHGLFLTYGDRDTVIEGGTVAAPDFGAPTADVGIDRTGFGSALAALGYSPYSDAAGVLNAFGGTALPVGDIGERSRAKVTGRPPQDSDVTLPGGAGQARARLADGPAAEATTLAAGRPGPGLAVAAGDIRSVVTSVTRSADSRVAVTLRSVSIGDSLRIESVVLSAWALADGAAGRATARTVVSGVTLNGLAVRLTPKGFEPLGVGPPGLGSLAASGIEVVSAGEASAHPGGGDADARATGPRLRFRSSDGRILTVVLGDAVASSSRAGGGS